jgi:hypothetical protein
MLAGRITRALLPADSLFSGMQQAFSPVEAELARLARFADPTQVYYYCACTVR